MGGIRDRDSCLSVHIHLHVDVQTLGYISIHVSLWPEVDMSYIILSYILIQDLSLNLQLSKLLEVGQRVTRILLSLLNGLCIANMYCHAHFLTQMF